jgi:hypothetical protein
VREQALHAVNTPYGRVLTYGHLAIACMTNSLMGNIALDGNFEDSGT